MILEIKKNKFAVEAVLAVTGADYVPVTVTFNHKGDLIALVENEATDEVVSYFASGNGSCKNLAAMISPYDGEFLQDLAAVQVAAKVLGRRKEKNLAWSAYK